jgi:hypothetical protein
VAKNKIQHMTADGKVHTRLSTRTYTHVVVADLDKAYHMAGKLVGPGPAVVAYTNAGSTSSFEGQWAHRSTAPLRLEPVNNGERAEDQETSIRTSASEYVTGLELGVVSTVSNVNLARRWNRSEALQVLAVIKAKHDNGAELFLNPKVAK